MNTNSKYRKIGLIVLAVVLTALLAVGAWLSLFTGFTQKSFENSTAVETTANEIDPQYFKERPYIVAETEELAHAYATKLNIPTGQFTFTPTSGVLSIDSNGTWNGMASTTLMNKYAHLLLPNSVKKIAVARQNATGTTSVRWVSITADVGSQLAEFEAGTSAATAVFGNGGGWLERVDLFNATKLKSIAAYTFHQCDRLYDLILPDTLTSIGAYAIGASSMVHISLPSGLGADGSGLDVDAFNYYTKNAPKINICKIVEIELPSNANSTFENKVKAMTSVKDSYLNVYTKGTGRSWLATTSDGFIFCKNILRTSPLSTQMGNYVDVEATKGQISYAINKWYLVGFRGVESGGDALLAKENYMVNFPKQVDLAKNGADRNGAYDYVDCTGKEIQNDFSDLASNTTALGSNVAINGNSRVIAGTSNGTKLRYDIGQLAFYFRWVWHTTIFDDTVSAIGDYAFYNAPMTTFNCGDVKYIGTYGLRFYASTQADLIFYAPSPNPFCASDGFITVTNALNRVFVYRNYADYNNRANYSIGLYARMNGYGGTKKYYTYLVDIVPNVGEWDASANAYKYTAVEDEKIQRLYTGKLSGYDSGLYANPYSYVRQSDDTWRYEEGQTFPSLTDYTGYSKTSWFTSTAFTTKYTETSIGTADSNSATVSLRNAADKKTDKINIYAKKIVSVTLENKVREYKDRSLAADETEITGIPSIIKGDYEVKVTSYVDSDGVAKSYQSIGSIIQEAGVYTIQIQPHANYGEWGAEDVPTMTVTVNKTEIDLGDYRIFRLGVTNGMDKVNLRPGKEVSGEQAVSLYRYGGSWFTDEQKDMGNCVEQLDGLWNSFVRAEGTEMKFSLTLVTGIIKDAHNDTKDIFSCDFSSCGANSESGEYKEQFKVTLTEAAKNNYKFIVTNDNERQFYGYANSDQSEATINKTWYIVKLNNWLTYQGESGNEARSYNMPSEWEFGSENVPAAPAVALGTKVNIKFSLELSSPNALGTIIINNVPTADFGKYINASMPVGSYRIAFTIEFEEDDKTRYDTFQQSFSFSVYEKDFTDEEMAAIDQIKGVTFEYDMSQVANAYARNDVLFDLSALTDATKKTKLQDMLALGRTPQWNTARVGIWTEKTYDSLFDSNFEITYNLNRMWNNMYLNMEDLLDEYPMNTPDVYIVYYQLTCKNRESLISPNNNDRRLCYFNIVVYRTLTAPQGIQDIAYTGSEIYPEISYLNGELEFEQAYYEVSFPANQDNVNAGDKKIILTIDPSNTQLYRWEKDASKNVVEVPYKIVPANNSTTIPLYMADWSWNSEITLDNIIWATQFGDAQDYTYTLMPVKTGGDNREVLTDITKFGTATAGDYMLVAYCPADKNGNWKEYEQSIAIKVSPAVNTWFRSPSISTWTWNQFEDYDWSSGISPISLHAIPTYYTSSDESVAGSGRFDFRIYSIDSSKTGNDRYVMVEFGENKDFHFQFEKDGNGNFVTNGDVTSGGHFVLPISVAKTLANLPAGQYYLVATVYSHNNFTGLNNMSASFEQGAVPFTISPANNIWEDTITVSDSIYGEFELGRQLHVGQTKYPTELKYSLCELGTTNVLTIAGAKLENITDFTAKAPGTQYTYVQIMAMLDAGAYTLRVHGDQASVNDRGGINYLAIDDQRRVTVNPAVNTLNENFASFTYTIGNGTDDLMQKYTARFESEKVGYRISKSGSYVDGLNNATTTAEPITFEKSLTYDELLKAIAALPSASNGNDFTIWWTTTGNNNYTAQRGNDIITVYLGQNDWKNGVVPSMSDWEYDGTRHEFVKNSIQLVHNVDFANIGISYYVARFNESTGQYERGSSLGACPIDAGNYLVAIDVPTDSYYKGVSTDVFFRVTATNNSFVTMPTVKNLGWKYSQLNIDDIVIGVPTHEEDGMVLQYVVYRTIDISGDAAKGSKDTEERMATLPWELGGGFNNNEISLDAFVSRLNLLDVGEYKLYVTLSASNNYKELELQPITLKVTQADNGWKDGKAPTINSSTSWEWDNYDDSIWSEVEAQFGNVMIYVNGNAVSDLAISRYLSELDAKQHTMKLEVVETDNYKGFTQTITFNITKNTNGWKDGESDATAFVHDWTWGEYSNDILGNDPTWVEPRPNYGTPYASIYKGKDGVGTSIRENIALYSIDIVMNYLDAGDYYIVWKIAAGDNYEALTRDHINFTVKVNPNEWDKNKVATMQANDRPELSGITYGWTWGEYGKEGGEYFTMPSAKYGATIAKIVKLDRNDEEIAVIIDGFSNELSISNTLKNLDAGRYVLSWSAIDLQDTGNFAEISYEKDFKFIVNMGVNSWLAGDDPKIQDWMWGEFKSSYWKAPGLQHGNPNATIIKLQADGTDGDVMVEKISSVYLNAQLETLGVGSYRLEWTADEEENYVIEGENPEDLKFKVLVNNNAWINAPAITAKEGKWQWGLFTLGYWTTPSAKYHDNNLSATVYKVDGDYIYNPFTDTYDFANCVERSEITLDTMDRINDLSVGKYLIKVCVPEDTQGRYKGLEAFVRFEIVPNDNSFTSSSYYVNGYAYQEFRGYWRAPISQFGEIMASIYKVENGVRGEKMFEVSTFDLNDVLRELHTGSYELDWTIVEDELGNYLSHTRTSSFTVSKANNRWLSRPAISDWGYGLYDSTIIPTAMPLAMDEDVRVYYKIVDSLILGEIAEFRAWAEKFTKDADGNYFNNGRLVLTADGYFTDITMVADVVKSLKPGTYYLTGYYPELEDYNRLDTNNVHLFVIRSIDNRWLELPSINSWIEGSTPSLPQGFALHGKVTWTYYKAVYDEALDKYVISGEAVATGEYPPEDAGQYILVASTESVEGYAMLREEIFFEVFEKRLTGVSGDLLLWIDIILATIASITTAFIIYTLIKARRRKNDEVFNG